MQKCFLPQLRCFQARSGPSIQHCTCWIMQAFSWQSSEGRVLRAMAGAGLSWRAGGRHGAAIKVQAKCVSTMKTKPNRLMFILKSWSVTYSAHVCSSCRLCMTEFVSLPCGTRMSLFLFLFTLTLVQTSRNGFSAGTYLGRRRQSAAQIHPSPRCVVLVRGTG